MKTTLTLMTLAMLLGGCGGRDGQRASQQEQYPVVQEGSASGVTSTINGPGETLPPITGTNADTTTNFALNPTAATTSVASAQPINASTGGSLAGTMPMTSTAAGVVPPLASHGTPMTAPVTAAPRAGMPPTAAAARRSEPAPSAAPAPAAEPSTDQPAGPAEQTDTATANENMTSAAPAEEHPAANAAPVKDKAPQQKPDASAQQQQQQQPSDDTTGSEQEPPPPPPPPAV